MAKEKKFKYKLWLEIELVEVDEEGNEKGEWVRGEEFGELPEEIHVSMNLDDILRVRDRIMAFSILD